MAEKPIAMSHYICYITPMTRGESGRIVIEVEPETKKRLYASLALSGSTLKDWFLKKAADYCQNAGQPFLFEDDESRSHAKTARQLILKKPPMAKSQSTDFYELPVFFFRISSLRTSG